MFVSAVSSYHKRCYYTVHGGLEEILNSDVNHIEITVAQGWRRNLGKYIEYINEKRDRFWTAATDSNDRH